jgi:hypothetical protein
MSEEKHERPFENITSEEDQEESKRPKKRRRPPFEGELDTLPTEEFQHAMREKFPVGNVFDAEIFEPQPAKMMLKRLKDEGYDVGD